MKMQPSEGSSETLMPATPLEVLADELGTVAGRIERDLRQQAATVVGEIREQVADLRAKAAELELGLVRFERDANARIEAALANVKDGRDGEPGPQGERGVSGDRGEIGAQGERGEPGPIGERGFQGERGEQGPQGERGFQGERGEQGPPGERGLDGRDGERGPEGPRGKLRAVKAWVDEVHYQGDIVHLDGSTWQATKDTAKQPPHEDWSPIAVKGTDGRDAREWVVRGPYMPDAGYAKGDVVAKDGGSYVAVTDAPGVLPGDGWRQLTQRGKAGPPGQRGEPGPQGKQGRPGVSLIDVTSEDYDLVLTMSDGTVSVVNLMPMFERYHNEAQR